jgi:hypothetical protein
MDGLLAVVVAEVGEEGVPEDHVALWFGHPQAIRTSEGGTGGTEPEIWTVPTEYCTLARPARIRH